MQRKYRHWCFTAYKKPDIIKEDDRVKYAIWQEEKCPDTERQHWQGYVEFKNPLSMEHVAKSIAEGEHVHVERRKGDRDSARDYCLKLETAVPESMVEVGHWMEGGQGRRTDLDEVAQMIKDGNSIKETGLVFPKEYIKYHRGMEKLKLLVDSNKTEEGWRDVKVVCLWGKTATGKSRRVREELNEAKLTRKRITGLNKGPNGIWWDGYIDQQVVILEDIDGSWMTITALLSVLDGYDCLLPTKGGFADAKYEIVICTSNLHPKDWYPNVPRASREALLRRFRVIEEVKDQRTEVGGNTMAPTFFF